MTIWSILLLLEIFNGHLVYFVVNWYIFPHFGLFGEEKSGNPDPVSARMCLHSFILQLLRRVKNNRIGPRVKLRWASTARRKDICEIFRSAKNSSDSCKNKKTQAF
jgi:hypothetical protein